MKNSYHDYQDYDEYDDSDNFEPIKKNQNRIHSGSNTKRNKVNHRTAKNSNFFPNKAEDNFQSKKKDFSFKNRSRKY